MRLALNRSKICCIVNDLDLLFMFGKGENCYCTSNSLWTQLFWEQHNLGWPNLECKFILKKLLDRLYNSWLWLSFQDHKGQNVKWPVNTVTSEEQKLGWPNVVGGFVCRS